VQKAICHTKTVKQRIDQPIPLAIHRCKESMGGTGRMNQNVK